MRDKIINFLRALVVLIVLAAIMLGITVCACIMYEDTCIENQEYSANHECVEFISYMEEDEFGDSRMTRIYRYSDGNIVEEHDYLRVEF